MNIKTKAKKQHFYIGLFIMLYNEDLASKFVDETMVSSQIKLLRRSF